MLYFFFWDSRICMTVPIISSTWFGFILRFSVLTREHQTLRKQEVLRFLLPEFSSFWVLYLFLFSGFSLIVHRFYAFLLLNTLIFLLHFYMILFPKILYFFIRYLSLSVKSNMYFFLRITLYLRQTFSCNHQNLYQLGSSIFPARVRDCFFPSCYPFFKLIEFFEDVKC